MKLKYKSCIKSFILFIIFNILSLFTFAIPEGMKPNGSEEPIPPVIKKTRAITSSFDVNEGDGFIIQDIGSGNIIVNKKNLVNGNNSISPKTLNVGGNTNNAFGYNSKDNYIYGIQMVTNSGHNLIKIGKDGGTVGFSLGKITGISLNESIFIGDFDKDGNMYVAGNNNVYKITIASNGTANAANIGSRESSTFADWGYTEINGKERFYYILNNGTLKYYEKSGGGLTGPTQVTTGLSTDRGTVVAVFMAGTNMFYNPSGTNTIYKVDLTAVTPTSLSFTSLENTTSSGDGARNYSKLIPNLAVGKEITNGVIDTNGDKIFSQGDEIKYKLVIKNSGNYPLGADDISKYIISDKVDLNKVESVATNVVAKKFPTLIGGIGTVVSIVPSTLTYDSTGKFELASELGKLPRLEIGERLEIEYTLKIKIYDFSGDTDRINNTVTGAIPNKQVTSDSQASVVILKPLVTATKISNKTNQIVQPGDEIEYTLTLTNTGKVDAKNYVVKDTLLSNPLLTKPTDVLVEGGALTGDIFESTGGVVTVPAGTEIDPGTVTITYTVTVPSAYPNETIVNSVNGGEEIITEVDKPNVRLRHDVFAYEEKFDDSNEFINQDEEIVTDFENIENKNSNPPVIFPGNKAIHFISLINSSKVDLKGKSDINHQLDGKQLKDDNGNAAFSEHKFQGIVLTNLDTNEKVFYSEKEIAGGQGKSKNTRMARNLPGPNELQITSKTSSFTFEEKISSRTAISFVFSSTVNSEGVFNKNTRISSYAFLPFDLEQNTSEGELRKAVIVIGRREADLVLSKSVEVEEASIGKFVPYTIEVKNMGKDPVDNIIISDKLPAGFIYVEGSAVQELKEGYTEKKLQVIGTKEIEIGPISQIKSGETIKIKYLLKVGVGVKPGTYKNIAVVKNENKENISNTDSVDIDIVADPIFEHTTVIGKVFHDRDMDGIQDYVDARKVHITINIPKEYYMKNTTTVSKDGKTYSFADNYTTITIRNIKGRISELEPATNNMVVIRKELLKPLMANVRVQTFGGTDITQQGNGEVITNHTGDKIKGMTSQDIVITQRVIKNKDNKIILEIFILNNGIQEEGLPGVRLATPEGIVVETDRFGRYHVPPVPETLGKNYIIKVDPTTLPKGSEFTTENPRVRHLGKVMMKFNFGVKLPSLKNPEKKDN